MENQIVLAASILGADPLNLEKALRECEQTRQVEWVQVDVMDGHFTPNLSFGPGTVAAIARTSSLWIDVHLMISHPKSVLEAFAKSGAHLITVHLEAQDSPRECLQLIKQLGKQAGIAIKPSTPVEEIKPLLPYVDLALVMTVEPGFAGQNYITGSGARISQVKGIIEKTPHVKWLEVDGGINLSSIPEVVSAGANVLVCGSSLFKDKPSVTVPLLRQAITANLRPKLKV